MKRVLLFPLVAFPALARANPSFTIGSNPYETVFAYPHDMLRWPNRAVFLLANPQTLPWQGDVTDIDNRPSESYTTNYQDVEFAPPSGYEGDPESERSWMRVSSYAYKRGYMLGGVTTTRYGKLLVELSRNHIFDFSHSNADAFFQNEYTVFHGRQLDLQCSTEHRANYKSGIRYRSSTEEGDNYKWRYEDGSDFCGDCSVDEYWKDRVSHRLYRAYSKARFWEVGDLGAGVLFFLQRASRAKTKVNKVVESDPSSVKGEMQLAVETNPFLNYRFNGGYLDSGVLLELSRTGMRNSRIRWNGSRESDQKDVLWSTEPYMGWSSSWESFSKGSEWFFATGWEANASIGLYRRLSGLLRVTIMREYTWTEKLYGQSEVPEGEHAKRDMWQVQEPTAVRVMIVYALTGR